MSSIIQLSWCANVNRIKTIMLPIVIRIPNTNNICRIKQTSKKCFWCTTCAWIGCKGFLKKISVYITSNIWLVNITSLSQPRLVRPSSLCATIAAKDNRWITDIIITFFICGSDINSTLNIKSYRISNTTTKWCMSGIIGSKCKVAIISSIINGSSSFT